MEEENKPTVEAAKNKRRDGPFNRKAKKGNRYPFEFRFRLVKGYLEEKYPLHLLQNESGVCSGTLYAWVRRYRKLGEAGLHDKPLERKAKRLPPPVVEKILALKKENRFFGVRRISDLLRRFFWLRASPEAVRQTLKAAHLLEKPKAPRKKNVDKVRFFERSTPNQLWQSDIFMFRLGGQTPKVCRGGEPVAGGKIGGNRSGGTDFSEAADKGLQDLYEKPLGPGPTPTKVMPTKREEE